MKNQRQKKRTDSDSSVSEMEESMTETEEETETESESDTDSTWNEREELKTRKKGEPCILSEEQWFTPTQFEKYGGKERNKKWKSSICYHDITLQTLIEEGILSSPSFKRRRKQDEELQGRRELFPSSRSPRHVPNGHQIESSDEGDSTVFRSDSLPVACSEGRGILHKRRFATGRNGKCIRTEDSWLTPEQFLNQNMRDGHWRKDITSHGKPLGRLLMMEVLKLDAVNCECLSCRGENKQDQNNDDECFICKRDGDLVCCDKCPRAFHLRCHSPPLQDHTKGKPWVCSFCKKQGFGPITPAGRRK